MARSYVHEARRRVGPKRNRVVPVIEQLAEEHPDATIALRFRNDLELLVSVMLSAQTTDVNVNKVTATLFEKYRRPEDYLDRKSTRLNSSHANISYAVFCLKKKKKLINDSTPS